MQSIIKLLPEGLANQIAAGEVVQRPASVVKELLENSIDAKCTHVELILKDAGKTLIQVIDNGVGLSPIDARMAFERHATSKIASIEDLFRIKTMGFRGEALASIAAVARITLKTAQQYDEIGTLVKIEGGCFKLQEPHIFAKGTSLAVESLFYNVPARRNFLKSNSIELKHIITEFLRVALANPEISFNLIHNDNKIYTLKAESLLNRVLGVAPNITADELISLEYNYQDLKICGYIIKPNDNSRQKNEHYLFVNKRFVKSNYLHHAVLKAYEGLVAKDFYPFYVIFLELEPEKIDINIHPTKTEIKFEDEQHIYQLLLRTVFASLKGTKINIEQLDQKQEVQQQQTFIENSSEDVENTKTQTQEKYNQQSLSFTDRKSIGDFWSNQPSKRTSKASLQNIGNIFSALKPEVGATEFRQTQNLFKEFKSEELLSVQVLLLFDVYLIAKIKDRAFLIDLNQAISELSSELIYKFDELQSIECQPLLFPFKVKLGYKLLLIDQFQNLIEECGFRIAVSAENEIEVRAIPYGVIDENQARVMLLDIIEEFINKDISIENYTIKVKNSISSQLKSFYTSKKLPPFNLEQQKQFTLFLLKSSMTQSLSACKFLKEIDSATLARIMLNN